MGWRGIAIGGWIGSLFGGPLGVLIGAALGHQVEKRVCGKKSRESCSFEDVPKGHRSLVFCASAAAMLAKMAKADGRVSGSEIVEVESAFRRLGFSIKTREYAINVFRRAKDDEHTIFEYAREFSSAVDSIEVRELFYELLWDIACADGTISNNELIILQRIPRALRIRTEWYAYYASRRISGGGGRQNQPVDALAEAYSLLGVPSSATNEELRTKYRELAKRHHPDALRAQGLPEEMIGKATEKMSRINSAWSTIKSARGI